MKLVGFALALLFAQVARAATINVAPGDTYAKIEGAQPGDEVVIAPGTYTFRVMLTQPAPASSPIVIRAQDPNNKPVWDFGATLVENAPGSYTAGDRGRGCWQISAGTNYQISGIVFTHCRTASNNSAGIRYYNGASVSIKDCIFRQNDNGLTGGTQDSTAVVEFSEFDGNGNLAATAPTHNIYIYGGTYTMRYSYLHDPIQGQNFHVRAKDGTIEYCWIARAKSYPGDLMVDDDFGAGGGTQSLTLRGNVILQDTAPNNNSQIVAVFNDNGGVVPPGTLLLSVTLINNTFVGDGAHAALVHLANADGTLMSASLTNNLVFGTDTPYLDDTGAGTVSGGHNWIATAANASRLAGTVTSASPGFTNAAGRDFTLTPTSACVGVASQAVGGLPTEEYYRDETVAREYRVRASAHDIGAFESTTTGAGIGPYGAPPPQPDMAAPPGSDLGAARDGGPVDDLGATRDGGGPSSASGCGCSLAPTRAPTGALLVLLLAAIARRWRALSRRGRATSCRPRTAPRCACR
jgi:hypothetical protein